MSAPRATSRWAEGRSRGAGAAGGGLLLLEEGGDEVVLARLGFERNLLLPCPRLRILVQQHQDLHNGVPALPWLGRDRCFGGSETRCGDQEVGRLKHH